MGYPLNGWKNKGGTSDRNAPGGSWKQYWQKNTNGQKWPEYCCVEGCYEKATDGAHMYCPSVDRREWIIPTCHFHNMQKGSELTLKNSTPSPLISANVR
ncbi:hypothetical protein [Selenomonas ruminantium]|uniref:hypothetical protein n=1 Tax=Selenomonas ruminantium TaxID=971 RepID=UPI0012FF0C8E|nr:hypothetical protein [Selenomonas ruminantium]